MVAVVLCNVIFTAGSIADDEYLPFVRGVGEENNIYIGFREVLSDLAVSQSTAILNNLVAFSKVDQDRQRFTDYLDSVLVYPNGESGLLTKEEIFQKYSQIVSVDSVSTIGREPYYHMTVKYTLQDGREVFWREDFLCNDVCSYALDGFSADFELFSAAYLKALNRGEVQTNITWNDTYEYKITSGDIETNVVVGFNCESINSSSDTFDKEAFNQAYSAYRSDVQTVLSASSEADFDSRLLNLFGIERRSKDDFFMLSDWDGFQVENSFVDFLLFSNSILTLGDIPVVKGVISTSDKQYFLVKPQGDENTTKSINVLPFDGVSNEIAFERKDRAYSRLKYPAVLSALAQCFSG